MKTTKRFESAVTKLYKAFHENRLNAGDGCACAVGNLLDNNSDWEYFRVASSLGLFNKDDSNQFITINKLITKTGYSWDEIFQVEKVFLNAMDIHNYRDTPLRSSKEQNFKGLCAVIEYLCELDNIPNVMDYTSLFETENNKPVKELSF